MRKSLPARHAIQSKFARLHGRIVELKERNKRAFTHASALNFVGSISPVRLPDFEADLTKLSRLSSPIGMDEIAGKYENIEELRTRKAKEAEGDTLTMMERMKTPPSYNPYDHDLIPDDLNLDLIPNDQDDLIHPPARKSSNENEQQTNFPTVISPMKRPQKDIEAEGKQC